MGKVPSEESSREAQSGRRLLGTHGVSLWLWCCLPQPGALGPCRTTFPWKQHAQSQCPPHREACRETEFFCFCSGCLYELNKLRVPGCVAQRRHSPAADPRSSWEMESKLSQSVKSRVTLRLHSPAGSVCNVHYGAASRRAEAED